MVARKSAPEGAEAVEEKKAPARPRAPKYVEARVACMPVAGTLNVREKPEAGAAVLRTLNDGDAVMALPAKDGWREVEGGGYCMERYLV